MNYELFIALRYMRSREKSRFLSIVTFISMGGIAIGVAALIIVLSVMNGFESGIREKIIGITAHITVAAYDGGGMAPDDSLYDAINSVPDIIAVAPVVQGKVAVSSRYSSDGVVLRGIDPVKNKDISNIHESMDVGRFDFGDKENPGIIIGCSLAENLGVTTGDIITVFSLQDANFDPLTSRPLANHYIVKGIFETGMYEYDGSLVYVSIEEAQWLFTMGEAVSFLDVKTTDMFNADKIAKQIDDKIGIRYFASDWSFTHKNLFSWMKLEKWAMFIALSLIVAVAGFNLVSNLIMIVLEKRRDIGILKSLGARSSSLKKVFIIKGMLVSSVGILIGILLGTGLCIVQDRYSVISLPADIYFISELPVEIHALDYFEIVAITLIIAFFASLYPASRAASLVPAEIMRYG
ncbi:MAG: lipoprotein-releasing ABC transporter permease subunit [candidate division Zixibacteria bacterium]|nr:lipoprotein-releasing ABC transporter permease subunit [candidate division Zixibacteria bacterium]